MKKLNWGIVATGGIANKWATALKFERKGNHSNLIAVGSRQLKSAQLFAKKWGIAKDKAYGSYAEVIEDETVDIVYIATPHPQHYELTKLALESGKHVLCEKPLTLSYQESKKLIELAKKKKLFLMEAIWMRFFPYFEELLKWLKEDLLGEIIEINADLWIHRPYDPTHRIYDPKLAGGALLDLGIYPLAFTSFIMNTVGQKLRKVEGITELTPDGMDWVDYLTLQYETTIARLSCSMKTLKPSEALVVGTKGYLRVDSQFHCGNRVTLCLNDKKPKVYDFPVLGNGYVTEVIEVESTLRKGKIESNKMNWETTLELARMMDQLLKKWKVVYPK